jgi:hypothetical protein
MEGGAQVDGGDDRTRSACHPVQLSRRALPDRFIQDALATGILSKKSSSQSARLVWQTMNTPLVASIRAYPLPPDHPRGPKWTTMVSRPRGWPLKPSKLRQSLALEQVVVERTKLMRSYAPNIINYSIPLDTTSGDKLAIIDGRNEADDKKRIRQKGKCWRKCDGKSRGGHFLKQARLVNGYVPHTSGERPPSCHVPYVYR